MDYQFTFTIGDWSRDGHNQFDVVSVESSHPLDEVKLAYDKGSIELGVDLIADYCSDYEDNSLRGLEDELKKLKPLLSERWQHCWQHPDDFNNIWVDDWFDLILAVIKLGNPEIVIKSADIPNWNIGGYGIFY